MDGQQAKAERGLRPVGRPRDTSRDAAILAACLEVLADQGYAGLTIDKVAARVGAGRATLYRRWPAKADLVMAAVTGLSQGDTGHGPAPDTGSLRGDLVALVLPLSPTEERDRTRILAAVAALSFTEEPRFADLAVDAALGPWVRAIQEALDRAVERGEVPPTDTAFVAQVAPQMCLTRALTRQPITREFSLQLIDDILLPAMRGRD